MIYVPQYRDRYQLERFGDNPRDDKGKPGQKRERKIYLVLILLPLPLHQIVQRSVILFQHYNNYKDYKDYNDYKDYKNYNYYRDSDLDLDLD